MVAKAGLKPMNIVDGNMKRNPYRVFRVEADKLQDYKSAATDNVEPAPKFEEINFRQVG